MAYIIIIYYDKTNVEAMVSAVTRSDVASQKMSSHEHNVLLMHSFLNGELVALQPQDESLATLMTFLFDLINHPVSDWQVHTTCVCCTQLNSTSHL
jgi:hypothetical protein